MIEGKVKLELFDGLTGKCQEKIESHNMMTGAIDKIVQFIMRHPYKGTMYYNPLVTHFNLLNSVCLFDSVLPENANQIWLPAGVKPTAYGVIGLANNSDNAKMMGTYDNTESLLTETSRKMVWTWVGSQGNGVISSLSLTHYNAGFIGFGGNQQGAENNAGFGSNRRKLMALANICESPQKISKRYPCRGYYDGQTYTSAVGDQYLDMCIDSDNDYKYMYRVNADGLSVIRHKMNFQHFDVFRSATDWQEYDEETYTAEFTGGAYFRGFYNTDEKKLYFWLDDSRDYYSNGYSCTMYYYDIVNKAVGTHGTFTNGSGNDVGTDLVVTNSAVYFHRYYSNPWFWKYSFQSGTTIECSGQATTTESGSKPPVPNNYILNGIITSLGSKTGLGSAADVLIDTSDDSVRYTVCSHNGKLFGYENGNDSGAIPVIPPYDNTQLVFGGGLRNTTGTGYPSISSLIGLESVDAITSASVDTFSPCNYLGTIFNLSEPVTKTAQQTMKLTYTLTAYEESE